MTFYADTVPVPLEDIFINPTSLKTTTPIPCNRYLLSTRDFLEYSMGYERGEMDALLDTEESFNITVREDVCESLFKHNWGLMQSEDELQRIVDFFWSNFDCGVKNRVWYTEEFPIQSSFTYRLFFNDKAVLSLPDGRPCISGQTLVTTTLHPLLAIVLASNFLVFNNPRTLDSTTHDVLLCLERVMARPLWLSWFNNRPGLTMRRPQSKAVRDLAEHLSD
ncbi:hypothetical protein CPB85DRAFT_1432161 [Mucidula mucida]|nr:hypothetical protein CPB85DRAFT_1432161 [Mucidula mucida]